MRIFHVATLADWQAARRTGIYTTSTRGRTLAEEGFIHASREEQWPAVLRRWYAGVAEPLVLLVVDTDRLAAPVVEEAVPGSTETFPHVRGPIEADAVVQVVPLDERGAPLRTGGGSASAAFLAEVFHRVLLASLVVAGLATGLVVGSLAPPPHAVGRGLTVGALVGAAAGTAAAAALHRRRGRRLREELLSGTRPGARR